MPLPPKTIALAGNPNAGKTSIFNEMTGSAQQVSNYPGVTVERKEGMMRCGCGRVRVIDLPGTYSLSAYSPEEVIARDVIINDQPDLVVNIIDASNLERNLYLTIQLMELRPEMILVLNMIDRAEKNGLAIDIEKMSKLLGVGVVTTIANRSEGIKKLVCQCDQAMNQTGHTPPALITYGHPIDEVIGRVQAVIESAIGNTGRYQSRWLAVKLIEGEDQVIRLVQTMAREHYGEINQAVNRAAKHIEDHFNDDVASIIAERRFGFAAGVVRECVTLRGQARQQATDQIDEIVCHKVFGPLILVAAVTALFFAVFKLSDEWRWIPWLSGMVSPTGLVEMFFGWLSGLIAPMAQSMPTLHSILDDAVIGGVGGVLGFVPLIFIMFFFIGILEDCGYVARVAFIMDRILRIFGLQGKSILPMIVAGGLGAGGCAVPAVMATRILRDEKDRLITMLVVPFMNCGAKLPVFAMLIAAFFPHARTRAMLGLWVLSWVVALICALILRKWVIKGEQTPFVMELPSYHIPMVKGVLRHSIERTWLYIKKAGTIILAVNLLVWAAMSFPKLPQEQAVNDLGQPLAAVELAEKELGYSFAGRIGHALEPLSEWAGFDWRTNIALASGFAAKELIVSAMGTVYSISEQGEGEPFNLSQHLAESPQWGPVRAFALMVFVMLYAPCLATVAVIRRESNSWKWPAFSVFWSTFLAFVLAVVIYQLGNIVIP